MNKIKPVRGLFYGALLSVPLWLLCVASHRDIVLAAVVILKD